MSSQPLNVDARIKSLNSVLGNKEHQKAVKTALKTSQGDLSEALQTLGAKLPARTREKVEQAQIFAEWSEDNVPLVKALVEEPAVKSLRDVALHFDANALVGLIDEKTVPETTAGATSKEKKQAFATILYNKLFDTETSAVLQRMVETKEVPIADPGVRDSVVTFLNNHPDFNIRTTSIYTALKQPEAFKGIADQHIPQVVQEMKDLQRVQALTPTATAVPLMMKANLTSAFRISEMPESTFLKAYGKVLGEDTARAVYTKAVNTHIRNEHALMVMREAARGTGLAIIDGGQPIESRLSSLQRITDEQGVPLNLESLFGDIDYCECEECTSVYSAAAYFVELLQYLRNNNLDPDNPNYGKSDIEGTPLADLFRRRPDLGCLELTCENTNTILPYVDLVNEVMESFVVHLDEYGSDTQRPKQSRLEVFNVEDETPGELLAQPQHTNYEAYCILKNAVYPFTLPYHQPIDATRIFLKYLGTSRYELLDTFRAALDAADNTLPTEEQRKELAALHKTILDRAADAEYLGLTQEEYIILTKQAFWPKRYFELTQNTTCIDDEYLEKIGVKPVHKYYGYEAVSDMLDTNESPQTGHKGLTFVKEQFLPRTGIQYTDLVDLLKTQCINPNFPQGKALRVLESVRFSYRFLQTMVDTSSTDRKVRFAKLIEFLEQAQKILPQLEEMLYPDPCRQQTPDRHLESPDLRHWVYCDFERIGKLIVLDAGEGPRLPIEGRLFKQADPESQFVGTLSKDGLIRNPEGVIIGNVTHEGIAVGLDGKSLVAQFGVEGLLIVDEEDKIIGFIVAEGVYSNQEQRLTWLPAQDTCDLDKVRLTHLDGTPVEKDEYDSMQRFTRLWRKTGWSIDETDKALVGLVIASDEVGGSLPTAIKSSYKDLDAFEDNCADAEGGDEDGCSDVSTRSACVCEITPEFLHQLVAVRKLLDLTGLPLIKLLAFWADISTAGEKSLYSRLFLTHNLLSIDKVFQADADGKYLTQAAKLSEHIPVLMTALKLKADDVTAIMKFANLADELTLPKVSVLYRHSLLAKALHVRVSDLPEVTALFGHPFKSATEMLALFETWGKMEDAGFTFRQLNYLVRNRDEALRPLAPAKRTILRVGKTLFDGLNAIDRDHPDVSEENKEEATAELIRTKTALLFDQEIIEQIVSLLEGTTVYITNAPANQTLDLSEALAKKIKYNDITASTARATLQVTGILTEVEIAQAKLLSIHPDWSKAIERIGKQTLNFFNDVLFGIFPDRVEAVQNLLAGDINLPDVSIAPDKRYYFLKHFMPFLRRQLTHRFIVETLAGAVGLANDVTDVLLSEILKTGTPPQPAIDALESIKTKPPGSTTEWKGYLIPSADEAYTFVAISETKPDPLRFDGEPMEFKYQQEDPSDVWSTDPTPKLKRGNLYWLEVSKYPIEQLQWKTASSSKVVIPASALLPDYTSQGTEEVLVKLVKAAMLVKGFSLSADEVSYWQTNSADFTDDDDKDHPFDFNEITLKHWKRFQAYIALRNSLPKLETTLLDLFKWANKSDNVSKLSERISAVTLWKKEDVDKLLVSEHFNLNKTKAFVNEINLIPMQKALIVAEKIGIDIDTLFAWAKPGSKFWDSHKIAEDIRKAIRARFDQEDWEQVVKPLNDQLRENQKQALINYLLSQKELIDWDVVDADSLFEFFLIDVQMDPCMETSRIKQAISSVQLFIQRWFLGLEEKYGMSHDALDRDRWEWMQRYRVWEANRKVFLYPENWIEGNLRDDKSPFFKELESELLQKDINRQNVEDALKAYLYKVDEVANMEIVGVHIEEGKKLHVFARTRSAPYFFYYRYFALDEKNWYPWEKMQVDIPSYDVEDVDGKVTGNGCYLTPVVWNERLFVFFPQFMKKTKPNDNTANKSFSDMSTDSPKNSKPTEYWEIKMAWSEYRNGKWTQKQLSKDAVYDIPLSVGPVNGATFSSVSTAVRSAKDASKTADDEADAAKAAAGTASNAAETSKVAAAGATNTVPAALAAAAPSSGVPVAGPAALAIASGVIIPTVNDLHSKAVTAKTEADNANSEAGEAKAATGAALSKAESAVTAVENYEKAIAAAPPNPPGNISKYEFVPVISDTDNLLGIKVYFEGEIIRENNKDAIFEFNGSLLTTQLTKTYSNDNKIDVDRFHHNSSLVYSLQISTEVADHKFNDSSATTYIYPRDNTDNPINFYHADTNRLLGTINTQPLPSFFKFYDETITPDKKDDVFGGYDDDQDLQTPNIYNELRRPYSIYNWELFFHTPAMLGDALVKAQQFEEALKWYHYIFNPLLGGMADPELAWQFLPFRDTDEKDTLEKLFLGLQPGQANEQINRWRNKPFQPHVIARERPIAYMKWVVMKYIEALIAWGDYLFRQDTIETINQATQLYVLAAHIYGPRGQTIPKRGNTQTHTYNSLRDRWDAFGNAMVEMELVFPFSNQTPFPIGVSNDVVGLANIFGFATTLYFCIPDNPKLRALRDTIDDRLFKIRHCENIEGVFRKLPLFEPPIDPALLVQAAAQGLSLSSVLNDLNSPMPNYRFYYLLQKALELCSELKALGNTFLSLKEKRDGEVLSLMRARHESSIHNLVMEVKKQQLEEANRSLESLQQSRKGPVYRLQHFLQLIGEDLGKVPNDSADFSELPNQIEQPLDNGGLKLIRSEKDEMDKAGAAAGKQNEIGGIEVLASIMNMIPSFSVDGKPIGIGAGISFGGSNIGSAVQAVARFNQITVADLTYQSTNAGRKTGFLRQLQDRIQQANVAGYEIKNIDKQILSQQIRINIANQEITNQQKQIDNAKEVEEFIRNKYTNQELYIWMESQIRTLYYQAYTLAYELAKKAEKVFRFERGLSTSNFIQFGYWDAAYDGLLSGEKLYVGLKQLEAAYQEKRGYDFEIAKPISLRQIDPMAVLQLRELGTCEFDLPEVLFDMDRPGDYKRRIKSVALTIPCVVGPYTSLNCTLRLLQHKFRLSAIAKDSSDYLEKTEETDERFSTTNIPITSIAVSTGQNDSGAFELNFRDERYIPFEGAGVISKWRLELPSEFRQFDYDTISDVILNIRYTSVDGGDKLKTIASESVQDYIEGVMELSDKEGLFVVFDLVHDFPGEWYKAMNPAADATGRAMVLNNLNDRLPVYTKGRSSDKIQATDVYLYGPATLSTSSIFLAQTAGASNELGFSDGLTVGAMKSFESEGIDGFPVSNWQLKIEDIRTEIEKMWLVVRYKLVKNGA
jgi:hypothetical protein